MDFIKHNNTWFWGKSTIIVTNDGCGVVTVQFENDCPEEANICGLSVYIDKRNNGYGNMLLKEAEQVAKENGKKYLLISAEHNSWIEYWYIRQGFKKKKLIPEYKNIMLLEKVINNE